MFFRRGRKLYAKLLEVLQKFPNYLYRMMGGVVFCIYGYYVRPASHVRNVLKEGNFFEIGQLAINIGVSVGVDVSVSISVV